MISLHHPRLIFAFFFIVLMAFSCEPEGHSKGWLPTNLLAYGPAVSIMAPAKAEIKKGKLQSSLMSDLTIAGGDDYNVQLFYGTATTNDIARLKNDQLQIVRSTRYFKRIVKEEVAGFIYQSMIDSVANYGFRFTKLQGNMELNFQTGLGGIFSLEDVELMYEGVK